MLSSWLRTKHGSKRSLLSLIGLLQHCCQALVLAWPFLRRVIDRSSKVAELPHFVWLSTWEFDDIFWWNELLDRWNGRSLFLFANQELLPDFAITSDAAGGKGFAAINDNQWFAGQWPQGCSDLNIAIKELIPIVLAASAWGSAWARKRVIFKCDNAAVVSLLRQGSCRDRHLSFLLRELTILAICNSFTFTAVHIPGKCNVHADALSRFNFQAFHSACPEAAPCSLPVPQTLLRKLVFPPWTGVGTRS